MALIEKLSAIGDAIREKTGKEDKLSLDQMPVEIASIETGGGGGGGGGVTLLYRAEVTEPVSAIDINIQEEWKQYFAWFVRPCQLTFNTGEWLCLSSNLGGNNYIAANGATANTVFDVKHSELIFSFAEDKAYFLDSNSGNPAEFDSAKLTKIRFAPYYRDKNTMISGAIEIYGVML